ncbi:MAG: YdiU family protein [Desulfamplus sp.]|nr:YdiU family protein [Desulfamplus sp.]
MNSQIYNTLSSLTFDNTFICELPGDSESANYRRQVSGACYSKVKPTPVSAPKLIAYSKEAAALLDISEETCKSEEFTQVFSGNKLLSGMSPYAACYGGHQFGNWAGQLGDGRAINLGEIVNKRLERWTLQIKGAGATPYSRNADGLAVLRSSVREFLCSEAMFHLGIPTTRALSIISTGEMVERDMFYNGNLKEEPGAVVCRIAPSFIRFGNFEIFAFRNDIQTLKKLLDYTIRRDFSLYKGRGAHLLVSTDSLSAKLYINWFEEVCRRTADMVVEWMRVGFVHGVMNTDNMSVLGLTIDYGPYGWIENYDPNWTPNTTDAHGKRYRFSNQPQIAHWNLAQLANAIYPLIEDVEPLQQALAVYSDRFKDKWQQMMAAKLGFRTFEVDVDANLTEELFKLLSMVETDMTIFFRRLALVDFKSDYLTIQKFPSNNNYSEATYISNKEDESRNLELFMDAYYVPSQLTADYISRMANWLRLYTKRLEKDNLPYEIKRSQMDLANPKYVLRNYLAQLAIDKAEDGDFSMIHRLLELLRHPYSEQRENEEFAVKRPDWARHRQGCSMLSCSS